MPKKTESGTLWDFSTAIMSQNVKKLKGEALVKQIRRKSLTMPNKTERGTIWDLSTYILSQNVKKLKEDLW